MKLISDLNGPKEACPVGLTEGEIAGIFTHKVAACVEQVVISAPIYENTIFRVPKSETITLGTLADDF